MKKLKIKLLYSFLILIILVFSYLKFINDYKNSEYLLTDTQFKIKVTDFKIDGDKLSMQLKNKQKIIANYYIKTESEKKCS